MKKKKIIFYGTPEIAAYQLEQLHKNNYNIIAVVTQPDKPSGRGQKINYSAVKQYALDNNLPLFQPIKLNEQDFIDQIKALQPDIQVVLAYRMIPKSIYSLTKYGTFNLHTSLLPQYRGAAPINWAIINGETQTGMTTFLLNEKTDEGEILLQETIEIGEETTAGDLHDEMMMKAFPLIEKTIEKLLSSNLQTIPQTQSENLKPAPKIFKETTAINWNEEGEKIINLIRGMSPYPAATTQFIDKIDGKIYQFKVFKAKFLPKENQSTQCGIFKIQDKETITVTCQDGLVQLFDLQLSGKKRMPAKELIKGLKLTSEVLEIKK
jgi:methionyl-tRNA formyltransferase